MYLVVADDHYQKTTQNLFSLRLLASNFMNLSVHVVLNSECKMLEIGYIMESGASLVFVALF